MICALNPFIWDKSNLRLPCINAHGVKVKGVDGGRGGGAHGDFYWRGLLLLIIVLKWKQLILPDNFLSNFHNLQIFLDTKH